VSPRVEKKEKTLGTRAGGRGGDPSGQIDFPMIWGEELRSGHACTAKEKKGGLSYCFWKRKKGKSELSDYHTFKVGV